MNMDKDGFFLFYDNHAMEMWKVILLTKIILFSLVRRLEPTLNSLE